jgi:DNA invertase Pin-like site-specific DNA recombinase
MSLSLTGTNGPIDTSTPQGMFSLPMLGAVAQLELALH